LLRKAVGLLAAVSLTGTLLCAAEPETPPATAASGTTSGTYLDFANLINQAGKQRMLSQRIAKDYLYMGKKIATNKASRQLKASLELFKKNQKMLEEVIADPEIKNLLAFVNLSRQELEETASKPFSLDNAQLVMDLSESMLEGSQYVVDSLKEKFKKNLSKIVAMSGKQRMLAQRIAKYYIAYQSGIKDKNTIVQMKATVKLFDDNAKKLMSNPKNTPEINKELKEINKLWKIVYRFYLNIEKGGLPFIVFTSTDNITSKMDTVTELYAKEKL
jgi:nitrate/nitrite-specific signal transduction histidine kinase